MTKNQFPINLNLEGRSCLVVGAGRIGLRKTEQLLAAGARVTVVAPEVVSDFAGAVGVVIDKALGEVEKTESVLRL